MEQNIAKHLMFQLYEPTFNAHGSYFSAFQSLLPFTSNLMYFLDALGSVQSTHFMFQLAKPVFNVHGSYLSAFQSFLHLTSNLMRFLLSYKLDGYLLFAFNVVFPPKLLTYASSSNPETLSWKRFIAKWIAYSLTVLTKMDFDLLVVVYYVH